MSLDLDDEEDAPEPEWMQIVTSAPAEAKPEVQEEVAADEIGAGSKAQEEGIDAAAEDDAAADEAAEDGETAVKDNIAAVEQPAAQEDALEQTTLKEAVLEDATIHEGSKNQVVADAVMEEVSFDKTSASESAAGMVDAHEVLAAGEAMMDEADLDECDANKDVVVEAATDAVVEDAAVGDSVVDEGAGPDAMMEEADTQATAGDEAALQEAQPVDMEPEVPATGIKRPAPVETRHVVGTPSKRAREVDVKAVSGEEGNLEKLLGQLPTAVRAKFQMVSKRLMLKAEAAQALLQADAKDGLVVLQALAMREKVEDPTRFVVGSLRKRLEMKAAGSMAGASETPLAGRSAAEASSSKPAKAIVRSKSGSLAGPTVSEAAPVSVPKAKVAKRPKASSQAVAMQNAAPEAPHAPAAMPTCPTKGTAAGNSDLQAGPGRVQKPAIAKGRVVSRAKAGAAKPPTTVATKLPSDADDQREDFEVAEEASLPDDNDVHMDEAGAEEPEIRRATPLRETARQKPASTVMDDLVRSPSAASRPAAVQKREPAKRPDEPSWDAADADAADADADADADAELDSSHTAAEKPTAPSVEKPMAAPVEKPKGASLEKKNGDSREKPTSPAWSQKAGSSWGKPAGAPWNKPAGASSLKPEPARIRTQPPAPAPPKAEAGPPKKKWSVSSAPVAGRPGAPPQKREGLEFEQEAVQEKLMALNDAGIWKGKKVAFDDAALCALLKIDAGSALDILADAEGQGVKCRFPSLFVQQAALKVRTASKS